MRKHEPAKSSMLRVCESSRGSSAFWPRRGPVTSARQALDALVAEVMRCKLATLALAVGAPKGGVTGIARHFGGSDVHVGSAGRDHTTLLKLFLAAG